MVKKDKTAPVSEQALWDKALNGSFLPPPCCWIFQDQEIYFGHSRYEVDAVTLHELALLDIHAQYWEATRPEYLRKYYRGLQHGVQQFFRANNGNVIFQTPSFLGPWLSRTICLKLHDENGREKMGLVLAAASGKQKSKLESGRFTSEDWKTVLGHKSHQAELARMIKAICLERQIPRQGDTPYSWRLPYFDSIKFDDGDGLNAVGYTQTPASCLFYNHELEEKPWESIQKLSASHSWTVVDEFPLGGNEVAILTNDSWFNDEIISAYLRLCGYVRPDIKFLSTQWFLGLGSWKNAPSMSISWISKGAKTLEDAIKQFTAVITVINYPKNHWITIRFNPKDQNLEVLDSLASELTCQKEEYENMILRPLGLEHWGARLIEATPQQRGYQDCGLYACQFAKSLALELPLHPTFQEEDVKWMRRMMLVELVDGRIRVPWK